jgi:hypothetical protein
MQLPAHLNWYFGWSLILSAFLTGAGLGLFFHLDDFLGGYGSFRRRAARLGHIAQAALGILNVLYGLSPRASSPDGDVASVALIVGAVAMPTVCYLTSWKASFRRLFFVPVTALVVAVVYVLKGGVP